MRTKTRCATTSNKRGSSIQSNCSSPYSRLRGNPSVFLFKVDASDSSFSRKRESRLFGLDSRLRGNDGLSRTTHSTDQSAHTIVIP